MKEVKIKVSELIMFKYLILGAVFTQPKTDTTEEKITKIKGLLQHKVVTEGIKIRLYKLLKSLDKELELIRERIAELRAEGKTEEEINLIASEIDNEEIIIQFQPMLISKLEDLNLYDDKGEPCDYSTVYEKFFE